jgi:hypothetical protein
LAPATACNAPMAKYDGDVAIFAYRARPDIFERRESALGGCGSMISSVLALWGDLIKPRCVFHAEIDFSKPFIVCRRQCPFNVLLR